MATDKVIFSLLTPIGIILVGYLLQDTTKQKFYVPQKAIPSDISLNVTLLGTNDLHSMVGGLGLKSYPELINGGYSKIVSLINSIRYVFALNLYFGNIVFLVKF